MAIRGGNKGIRMTDPVPAAADAAVWQNATVLRIVEQTSRIKSFFLAPEKPFSFEAGQHVDLRLRAEDGYVAMRSYSIASTPHETREIELSIERLDDGEVSPFFHDVVVVGDQIELRGPLGGHFVWRPEDGGPIFLIGGGSGVVPLMSMIRSQQGSNTKVPTKLLLAARTWKELLYRDELLAIDHSQNNFEFIAALSREQPKRNSDYGRRLDGAMIRDLVQRLPSTPKFVFVCGNNSFVNVAADGIVQSGIPASRVRTERYGGV